MAEVKGVNNGEINREEIQAAIAKAVELRALHAALMQGNSPSHLRFRSSTSPNHHILPSHSRPSSQFSGHDYPVFTPSYEDEHVPGYGHVQIASQTISENWDVIRDNQSGLVNFDSNNNSHIRPAEDCKSVASSCTNTLTFLQNSPGTEVLKSRRIIKLQVPKGGEGEGEDHQEGGWCASVVCNQKYHN